MSQRRIREWYEAWDGQVYVSFSGGKDSTVLLHLVREMYPDVPAVFVDTGLEYPEIRGFVKSVENVEWLRPKMNFKLVIEGYGWPVISKECSKAVYQIRNQNLTPEYKNILLYGDGKRWRHISAKWHYLINSPFPISSKCCQIIKKSPTKTYSKKTGRKPFAGEMADEGQLRRSTYLRHGCNQFDSTTPRSMPLSFWSKQDVWEYIKTLNLPYSAIYDMGYTRTGCMFCAFGAHLEQQPNRFQLMKHTHPKLWEYCMFKLGMAEVLDYIGVEWGSQMEIEDYIV